MEGDATLIIALNPNLLASLLAATQSASIELTWDPTDVGTTVATPGGFPRNSDGPAYLVLGGIRIHDVEFGERSTHTHLLMPMRMSDNLLKFVADAASVEREQTDA